MTEEELETAFANFKNDSFLKDHLIAPDFVLKAMFNKLTEEQKKSFIMEKK